MTGNSLCSGVNLCCSPNTVSKLLKQLEQTSSVAEYKANFDVLCMRAKIAPEQQLLYWYDGLKNGFVSKINFDLVTKSPMPPCMMLNRLRWL